MDNFNPPKSCGPFHGTVLLSHKDSIPKTVVDAFGLVAERFRVKFEILTFEGFKGICLNSNVRNVLLRGISAYREETCHLGGTIFQYALFPTPYFLYGGLCPTWNGGQLVLL